MNFVHRCKPHGKRMFAADASSSTSRAGKLTISDPTGTLSLQKKFQKELRMRWDAVRKQVPDAVLRNSDVHATINSIIGDPVKSFQSWIDEAMRQLVMGINGSWTLPYVRGAGDIGTQRAKTLVAAAQSPPVNPPAYVDRVPVMQSLAISELQGIMDAVSQQAVREFTTGLMIVRAPNKTAKAIQNIIDTTGKRRSDMLANFMCVRTFGTATLDHYRANGVNSVGTVPERIVSPSPIRDAKAKSGSRGGPLRGPGLVRLRDKKQAPDDEDLVEVLTAGDNDVCEECQDISDEGPYDLDEAESLIPAHPNCRCAFVPWDDERFAGVRDEFKEEDHPRDEKGKFAAGQGSGASEDDHWNSIGGAPFKSMDAPKDQHGWAQVEGQNHGIDEPPLPNLKQKPYTYSYTSTTTGEQKTKTVQPPDKRMSSGVIMREPDGRTWLVKPSNNFGGYNWTFPKGGVEEGLHPQANAIKEAYEESGLHAKITGYAGDYHGDTSITRMYHAERIGGHPKDHQWETEQVALAHPDDVMGMLNRSRDKKIASHHILKDFIGDEFREEDHPRDDHGKFTEAGGGGATPNAGSDPKFEAKIEKLKSGATKGGYNFSHYSGDYGPSDIGGMHALEVDNEHEIAVINAAAKHGIALTEHPEYSGNLFKVFTASHAVEAPAPTISIPHQLDMNELNKTGGKMGSNAGGTYEDKAGNQYYIKNPATTDHVQNELMAAKLYQLAGARTMDYVPVKGGAHVATELQNLDKNNISQFTPAEKTQAQKDFGVHAWTANWDAAGTGGDNQVIIGGKTHTVDVGGALKYRAMGTPKGDAFGDKVTETQSLLDASKNPDSAKLYSSMTDAQKIASYQVVTSIPDNDIRKTVYAAGGNTEMADKLVARKADLFKQQKELEAQTAMAKSWESPPSEMAKEAAAIAPKTPSITPHPDPTSKMGIIHHHLTKEGGTTSEELKKALNWPAIGIPKMASNLNLNLEKTKEGGVFKYKGTPMTPEQIAANKNAPKAAKAAAAAPPPEPPKTILGPSTKPEPYPPEVAKLFEPTPKHDLNTPTGMFKQSLDNKGVPYKFMEGESYDHFHFSPDNLAKAKDIAKFHPQVEGSGTHMTIPKSAETLPFSTTTSTAKATPHPLDFQKELDAKGIAHGDIDEHSADESKFKISAPTKSAEAMAEVAKNHPEWQLIPSMKSTYLAPKSAFGAEGNKTSTQLLQEPIKTATPEPTPGNYHPGKPFITAAGFDINKPTGAFKQSLHEHNVEYQIGHGELYEHYTPNTPKDKDTMAQIAQYHPAAIDNGDGSYSIKKESGEKAGATQAGGTTTFTPEQDAKNKAAFEKALAETVKPPPVTPPTDAELQKAKKNVKLQMQYVPGASGLESHPEAQKLLAAFNAKYEGKTLAEHELPAKVADFKQLAENMKPLMSEQQKAAATAASEAQAKQMATAAAAKAKMAEEEAKIMADPETAKHIAALKAIGSNIKPQQHDIDFIAKHKLNISPLDAKYIRAYVGHHYGPVNEQLRKGSLSPDQASFAKRLSDGLNKMPVHTGIVERGASLSEADFNKYVNNVGKTVVEQQFTSAGKKNKLWGSHSFTIVSHNGRDISKFNPGEGGGEVVFDKGTLFHVTKVDKAKKHVWMEEVA